MERKSDQIELLISLLVRFPQICRVHYEPGNSVLRLVFLVKEVQGKDFSRFASILQAHLAVFRSLRQAKGEIVSLRKLENDNFILVEISRDVFSLSLEELNLIIQLISEYYEESLIQEGQAMDEDDELEQNALIESILSSVSFGEEHLTGFREDGRVLVFTMPLAGGVVKP